MSDAMRRSTARGLEIVGPRALWRLATRRPSEHGEIFPATTIPASSTPRPAPVRGRALTASVPWRDGAIATHEFLHRTHTNAFLVLHDGMLVHEWYRSPADRDRRMPSWSVAKSIVGLLVGQAIGRGELREQDRLVDLLPELRRSSPYDDITVRHLLDMSSGVDVTENYNPWLPLRGTARLLLSTNLEHAIRSRGALAFLPGSRSEYRSIDTQLLGAILSAVTRESLSSLLAHRLWEPLGCERAARWNTDRPGGTEKAFCGINATARDFAKIGQLVLDGGRAGGVEVVPAQWITRTRTASPHPIDGWGYSAQWWLPRHAEHDDLAAIGVYGQYVYVDPATRTVIVKLSDHGAEEDELETIQAMRAIAGALEPTRPDDRSVPHARTERDGRDALPGDA